MQTNLENRWFLFAEGTVLEVGIGSALNPPYYSTKVAHLCGIDPSLQLLEMARGKIDGRPFPVTLLQESAAKIPLPDNSVDTVVTTWVLCSVCEDLAVLREMRRVLRPGGQLIFIEHGLSPDPKVKAWQNRITPIWRRLGGGCCLGASDSIGRTKKERQEIYNEILQTSFTTFGGRMRRLLGRI